MYDMMMIILDVISYIIKYNDESNMCVSFANDTYRSDIQVCVSGEDTQMSLVLMRVSPHPPVDPVAA